MRPRRGPKRKRVSLTGEPATPISTTSIDHIEEHSRAWIVTFSTGRYRAGDVSSALAGTSPFVIEKANGELHRYGSGPDEYEEFLAWLDAAR